MVVVVMMSASAVVVVPGVAVVIMVVMSPRREGVDVEEVGVEEEEMMEEAVASLEGCQMLDGAGVVLRRLLGHLGDGTPRLTGGD